MTASQRLTLAATVVGSGVVFLDATVVTVALARIGADLVSPAIGVLEGQSYVYNGYLLTLSALLVLAGALSDFHGRRRMFLVGLGGFALTSLLCGLAPTLEWLIVFRLAQGASAALLVPGSLSIITAAFPASERGRAIGIWAGAATAAGIVGPYFGGLLVGWFSWRAAFLVNVPLAALAAWLVARGVAESRDESATGRFDWPGAALIALGVGGLSFGVIYGQQREWQAPLAFVALAVGLLATAAFPLLMARRRDPLIPLEIFRSRNFSVTNLSTLLIYGSLYLFSYYLPIFNQNVLGYSAAAAGAAMVPGFVSIILFSSTTGGFAARSGPRLLMALGPALMGLGLLWLMRVPADSPPLTLRLGGGVEWILVFMGGLLVARVGLGKARPAAGALAATGVLLGLGGVAGMLLSPGTAGYARDVFPAQFIWGVGATLMIAPLTTALMASLPVRRAGLASAINNAVSRIGPQLAGAVLFVAVTATFYASLAALAPHLDTSSPAVRTAFPPLNHPLATVVPGLVDDATLAAAHVASTDAFHLAMAIASALAMGGAIANALGIVNPPPEDLAASRQAALPEQAHPGL